VQAGAERVESLVLVVGAQRRHHVVYPHDGFLVHAIEERHDQVLYDRVCSAEATAATPTKVA
jgi:hypothetical protein